MKESNRTVCGISGFGTPSEFPSQSYPRRNKNPVLYALFEILEIVKVGPFLV